MTRYDRYGDDLDDDDAIPTHDQDCADGWLGEDYRGRPIPCLQCRPHLRERWP